MNSFRDVIDRWPDGELAGDIREKAVTVRSWRNRDSIPAQYWPAIVAAATKRKFTEITTPLLTSFVRPRKKRGEPAEAA